MRPLLLGLTSVLLAGCFCGDGAGGGAGGGSGGGGSGSSLRLDLVEMNGTFTLSGQTVSGTCTNVTTEAKVVLSLSKPDLKAVTWTRKDGTLSGYVDGTMTLPATVGTTTCGTSAPKACPTFPDKPYTGAAFIGVNSDPQMLGASPAPGVAFVPVLTSVNLRSLCAITPFVVGKLY